MNTEVLGVIAQIVLMVVLSYPSVSYTHLFVTTLPAPIMHRFPIVTPGQIIAPPPIQQSSPIVIGYAYSLVSLLAI